MAAFVAGKAGRDAILLANFAVTSLPFFIAASAVVAFPVILITGRLLARYGPNRLIPLANVVSAGVALIEWRLLAHYPRPAAVAVFFHLSVSGAVLVSGFWSVVNERLDVQAAKRDIGQIGMGASLGGILGGLFAERTAAYATPETIMLVIAGLQLASAGALLLFRGKRKHERVTAASAGMWSSLVVIKKSGLLRNLAAVVVLAAVAGGVLDYVFKADIVGGSSREHLLRSLAIFYTVTNAITAAVQLAVGGYVIARLGVPRSVASLPATISVFGAIALVIPTAVTALAARAAELIVRNSVYRGAYELLYAPLAADEKRPTKILIDVGADRIGDILGAQLVALLVFSLAEPRTALLLAALATGLAATVFALRLRARYATALEESLLAHGTDADDPAAAQTPAERWSGAHELGQSGDFQAVSMLRFPRPRPSAPVLKEVKVRPVDIIAAVTKLRSGNAAAIKGVLATPLTVETAPHVIDLVATPDVGPAAIAALTTLAPRITGLLVDALLDQTRDLAIRRQLPAVIAAGDRAHATWGLWRGLVDPSFELRYRCGAALKHQGGAQSLEHISAEEVYAAVSRELAVDREIWRSYRLDGADPAASHPEGTGLDHVFTLLGLVLPVEPLQIALTAVQTDDSALRGTALEYLESILPSAVRAQLWPLIAEEPDRIVQRAADDISAATEVPIEVPRAKRGPEEVLAELRQRSTRPRS